MAVCDMLVKLYELPPRDEALGKLASRGVVIRKPLGGEKHLTIDWVREHFSDAWASEADVAMAAHPGSCFIAVTADELVGFACYDATALGFFGPIGVREDMRGQGIGEALLLASLHDMRAKGYGYAAIGAVGPAEFYEKTCGAVVIPDSKPGLYKGMLRRPKRSD